MEPEADIVRGMSLYKSIIPSEALIYAILTGKEAEVRHLARLGANIQVPDAWILYDACLRGTGMISALSLNPRLYLNPAIPGQMGDTVFHFLLRTPAARFCTDKLEVISLLLHKGVNIWERDRYGNTTLNILSTSSSQACSYDIMKIVFAIGPYVSQNFLVRLRSEIDATNEHGNTPLLEAVLCNNTGCAELLLEQGCNANFKGQFGKTALFFARSRNSLEMLSLLRSYKAVAE